MPDDIDALMGQVVLPEGGIQEEESLDSVEQDGMVAQNQEGEPELDGQPTDPAEQYRDWISPDNFRAFQSEMDRRYSMLERAALNMQGQLAQANRTTMEQEKYLAQQYIASRPFQERPQLQQQWNAYEQQRAMEAREAQAMQRVSQKEAQVNQIKASLEPHAREYMVNQFAEQFDVPVEILRKVAQESNNPQAVLHTARALSWDKQRQKGDVRRRTGNDRTEGTGTRGGTLDPSKFFGTGDGAGYIAWLSKNGVYKPD